MQGIERLPGAHCYSFYAGEQRFAELAEQNLGTFYLTDFLVEHFDRLIIRGLRLDEHPELRANSYLPIIQRLSICRSGRTAGWSSRHKRRPSF